MGRRRGGLSARERWYVVGAVVLAVVCGWFLVQAALAIGPTERVPAHLGGHDAARRTVNVTWEVVSAEGSTYDVEVGPSTSRALERWQNGTVTALVRGDTVVAIETSDGHRYDNLDVGVRGVVLWGAAGTFAVGCLVILRRRRRGRDGSRVAALVVAVSVVVVILMQVGVSWSSAVGLGAIAGAVLACGAVLAGRRDRSRPGRRVREQS